LAIEKIAAAARIAVAAVSAVPADSNALADFPSGDVRADGVDYADDFVTGNARVLNPGHAGLFDYGVAVTDSAGLDFDADAFRGGFWDIAFYNFKWSVGARDLDCAHLCRGLRHENLREFL
jgi:hypothetical protein